MHKYVLKLTRYTEEGAPTLDITYISADTPQGIADKYKQYNNIRYTDEEGRVGNKMYRVEPMQGEYVVIADWDTFCEVNKVLN